MGKLITLFQENTKLVMYVESLDPSDDTIDDHFTPQITTTESPNDYERNFQQDGIDEPDLTNNEKFSQKNIVFEIKNDAGNF